MKIEQWADEALASGLEPNEAITQVLKDELNSITPDMIKRVVEAYNVKNFLSHQKSGHDMEDSFPLASAEIIIAKCLKDGIKEAFCGYGEVYVPEKIEMMPELLVKKEAQYSYDNLGRVEILMKCAEYVKKFDEYYRHNNRFISELRYLYPQSIILKNAGLEKGEKHIPDNENQWHQEFGIVDKMIIKYGINEKKKIMSPEQQQQYKEYTASKEPLNQLLTLRKEDLSKKLTGKSTQEQTEDKELKKLMNEINAQKLMDFQNTMTYIPDQISKYWDAGGNIAQKWVGDPINKLHGFAKGTTNFFQIPDLISSLKSGPISSYGKTLFDPIVNEKIPPTIIFGKDIEKTYQNNTDDLIRMLAYKNQFESIIKNDSQLQGADPNMLLEVYENAIDIAPDAMLNPGLVKNVLRTANSLGSPALDPSTIKLLLEIERYTVGKKINFEKMERT